MLNNYMQSSFQSIYDNLSSVWLLLMQAEWKTFLPALMVAGASAWIAAWTAKKQSAALLKVDTIRRFETEKALARSRIFSVMLRLNIIVNGIWNLHKTLIQQRQFLIENGLPETVGEAWRWLNPVINISHNVPEFPPEDFIPFFEAKEFDMINNINAITEQYRAVLIAYERYGSFRNNLITQFPISAGTGPVFTSPIEIQETFKGELYAVADLAENIWEMIQEYHKNANYVVKQFNKVSRKVLNDQDFPNIETQEII